MEETKPWWASKSIWLSIAQIVVGLAVALGVIDNTIGKNILGAAPEVIGGILAALLGTAQAAVRITEPPKAITLTDETKPPV